MKSHTPKGRALAIVAGLTFTAGALIILMGSVLLKPLDWTSYHVLTVLTVFGTIAVGHLMADAVGQRHVLAALGFMVLFIAGTSLVVYNSVGRQAETSGAVAMSAEATNKAVAGKASDIQASKDRLIKANHMIELHLSGGVDPDTGRKLQPGCGTVCQDWKKTLVDENKTLNALESDLAALGPQKPVNAKAAQFAEMIALFGGDKAKVEAIAIVLEPFLWTLFLEFGSIISWGFAFRSSPSVSKPQPAWQTNELPEPWMFSGDLPEPPKPRKRKSVASNVVPVDFRTPKHPVVEALESNGGTVASNRELARLMGVTEGESSKRVQEVARLVTVERDRKQTRISLKKSA